MILTGNVKCHPFDHFAECKERKTVIRTSLSFQKMWKKLGLADIKSSWIFVLVHTSIAPWLYKACLPVLVHYGVKKILKEWSYFHFLALSQNDINLDLLTNYVVKGNKRSFLKDCSCEGNFTPLCSVVEKRSPQQWPEGVINATTRNAQRKKGNVGTASTYFGQGNFWKSLIIFIHLCFYETFLIFFPRLKNECFLNILWICIQLFYENKIAPSHCILTHCLCSIPIWEDWDVISEPNWLRIE